MPATERALSERTAPASHSQHENGLARERVAEIQRARMLAAMAQLACEDGARNITVARVVARSGVSRRTFYEIFEDRDDCLLGALDEAVARASRYVAEARDSHTKWVDRIRVSLLALLRFLDDEPAFGRLAVVESLGAGAKALGRRADALARVMVAVDRGRSEAGSASEPLPLAADGVVGAVFSVIHSKMLESSRSSFVDLTNPFMAMIVLPYLGPAASRRELERPTPDTRKRIRPPQPDQLAALNMRLTYRTMRVLTAIGSHPGSSNREVADVAGVGDPGQISKLLARLSQLGLIEKAVPGSARGEPNAWKLTKRGEEVRGAIVAQAAAD